MDSDLSQESVGYLKVEPEAKTEPAPKPGPSEQADGEAAPPPAPVKGLGIARGARPPGKR